MKYKPHDYQRVATQYILDHKGCGLFLDMGLGKTVITLTALSVLKEEYFDLGRCLIIAPARVIKDTWPNELEKWDHLHLSYSLLTGSPKERRQILKDLPTDLYLISRELVVWLVKELAPEWPFDMVVIDELSSFKSPQAKRFRALRQVRPMMNRVVGLTGTPKPNSYQDLWSELYLLDGGKRLGRFVTHFRRTYFNSYRLGNFTKYDLLPGAGQQIEEAIKDICISMKAKDYLSLQKLSEIDYTIHLETNEKALYRELSKEYLLSLGDHQITALNGATLATKLLQLSNGAVYDEKKEVVPIHNKKLEVLKELAESGENLLVFYQYVSDRDRILQAFPEAVAYTHTRDGEQWNAGKIKMLVCHAGSVGYGLNLQEGGHIIVWFGLPWSSELYEQANRRLYRQGQTKPVLVYRLLAGGTYDEKVRDSLKKKISSQEALLESLKAELLESEETNADCTAVSNY